jgi:hypothetical protein
MRITALNAAGTANGYLAIEGYSSEYARFSSSGDATFNGAVNATGALSTQSTLAVGAAGATATVSGVGNNAPLFFCRAWVTFNPNNATSGTATIYGSGNVSSVTINALGDYTINFTTAMPNANYGIMGMANNYNYFQAMSLSLAVGASAEGVYTGGSGATPTLKSTSQVRILVGAPPQSTSAFNPVYVSVAIIC